MDADVRHMTTGSYQRRAELEALRDTNRLNGDIGTEVIG
jgi:hypothetical protein